MDEWMTLIEEIPNETARSLLGNEYKTGYTYQMINDPIEIVICGTSIEDPSISFVVKLESNYEVGQYAKYDAFTGLNVTEDQFRQARLLNNTYDTLDLGSTVRGGSVKPVRVSKVAYGVFTMSLVLFILVTFHMISELI